MGRTVRDAKIGNRTTREKLSPCHEPYWRAIDGGMHLGYRKGARKSSWLARYRTEDGKYVKTVLGIADDAQDADGYEILSFSQAQEKARVWFADLNLIRHGVGPRKGPYTVADVMTDYLEWFEQHRKGLDSVRFQVSAHILPRLGRLDANKLTADKIRAFHEGLAKTPARIRTRPGRSQRYRDGPLVGEELRRRKCTANKLLNILRAALNRAFESGKIARDDAWRKVKPFKGVDVARVRHLTEEECGRLVAACERHFGLLVRGAILTGCRYGELTRLRVGDLKLEHQTVFVETSKSGKPRFVDLSPEGVDFFAGLAEGRRSDEILFLRPGGAPWGKSHQRRPLLEACARAGIEPAVSFHIMRHTYATHLATSNLPLYVLAAQLGHADTRMVEKHYAHLTNDYKRQALHKAFAEASGYMRSAVDARGAE